IGILREIIPPPAETEWSIVPLLIFMRPPITVNARSCFFFLKANFNSALSFLFWRKRVSRKRNKSALKDSPFVSVRRSWALPVMGVLEIAIDKKGIPEETKTFFKDEMR